MDVSRTDVTMLIYNFAVVLTGMFLVTQAGIDEQAQMFVVAFIFGLIWTVYFRFAVQSQITDRGRPDEES